MSIQTSTWPNPSVVTSLNAVRDAGPFVFGLTNYIAAPLSANILLAVGAAPAIGGRPAAAQHFAAIAGGAWINLAALVTDTPETLLAVADAASASGKPWVLDPVTVGAGVTENDALAQALLARRPAIIRGNASEIIALAGGEGGTRGVETTATAEAAIDFGRALAQRLGTVVAISGPTDYVTDGTAVVAIPGGHVNLTRVTGAGCSLGGLVAAFAAAVPDRLQAAVAAHAVYAAAAERAGARTRGTAAFAAAFVDELSYLGLES